MSSLPYISPDLVKSYQDQVAKSASPATAERTSISLNRFFDWAKNEGHVDENPLDQTKSQPLATNSKNKDKIKTRTWATICLTISLVILIFLLTWKLKVPIPIVKNFAQGLNNQTAQNVQNIPQNPNQIPANSATIAAWNLYAKVQLTDTNGVPQVGSRTISFKLYNQPTGGDALYTSSCQTVTTDSNGSVLISLDQVPSSLFFQNNTLYLEPEIISSQSGSSSESLRIPVSTANTPANLGGYFPANPDTGATAETVPVIDSTGALVLASQSPAVKAKEGNLLIEGQTVTVKTAAGGRGNIEISPDGNGYAHFLFQGSRSNFLNAQAPHLTTGSLYYGMVPNNATGYDLVKLQSGAPTMTTRFTIDALGNVYAAGNGIFNGQVELGRFSSLPGAVGQGSLVFNSSDKKIYFWDGTNWVPLGSNSFTDTDTLDSVTSRGSTTANAITVGNLTSTGTTTFGGITYTWPGTQPTNYILSTDGSGTLSWVDPSIVAGGTNYWDLASGALFPKNNSVDLLIGGSATTSAKFAFTGVNGGLPTASISGTTAATFIDGNGNISTTNRNNLTLGNSSTYSTTGNILLNPNQMGNVGIGTANPRWMLYLTQTDAAGTVDNYRAADFILARTVGDSGGQKNSIDFNANYQYTGTGTSYAAAAVQGAIDNLSTGTIFEAIGVTARSSNDSTGRINFARGLYAQVGDETTGGTIDNAQGVFIGSAWNHAGGTITNNYGLYIENQESGINNYAIYSAGSKSYFAGAIGIGTATPSATLDVAGNASVSGTLTFRTGTGTIQTTAFSPLIIGGNTTGNITLNPSNAVAGGKISPAVTGVTDLGTSSLLWRNIYGTALYQGIYQVCDSSGSIPGCGSGSGTNYWALGSGTIYPIDLTRDLLIGASATASAKFAFMNVSTGTPTASISGSTARVATFIDGNGNISTTNGNNLTLGNSSTYSTTGNILLNPNQMGNVGIGMTNPRWMLFLTQTDTSGTVENYRAADFWLQRTVGDSGGQKNSVDLNVDYQYSGTGTTYAPKAVQATVDNLSTGTIFEASGVKAESSNDSTGTINFARGVYAIVSDASTGTIDNAQGVFIGSAWNHAGGTITNNYGLYIENQESGINNYAIYSAGSKSYFAGAIGIGTATPSATLDVAGNASVSGTLTLASGSGTIQTTAFNPLVLGGSITGNIILSPNGTSNVGIGTTTPGYLLTVNSGTPGCNGCTLWTSYSDSRLKENVAGLSGDILSKIMQLNPVTFNYNNTYYSQTGYTRPDGTTPTYTGFIAQDLQQIFPEMVNTASSGYLDTNLSNLQIYLVKGIQQQQREIATISDQIVNLVLTDAGDINISQDTNGNYQLTNTANGSVINQIGAFANVVAANIKAGAINTTDFVTENVNAGAVIAENITTNSFTAFQGTIDNLLIKSGLVTPNLQVALISPLPGNNGVTVQIGTTTQSGQFVIQNASGSAVAAFDNTGNATFSGQLAANGATVSGTLYAGNIKSRSLDDIQNLLTQVQSDQNLLSQAASWNINTATNSAQITNQLFNQLTAANLYVTNQATVNSLSVTNSLTVGTDLVFSPTDNSLNSLSAPLKIQGLAMAPVEIMNGLVTIDTKGNVNIAGDLFVAGRIHSSGLILKDNQQSATASAGLLTLQDVNGNVVSSVNASGSAAFNSLSAQGLTIAGSNVATASSVINGVITTNSTVGSAVIPAGTSEVVIKDPKVTDYTLVYVTPTSSTDNYVLYVKSKQNGQFAVGFSNPISVDADFNWWIIQAGN